MNFTRNAHPLRNAFLLKGTYRQLVWNTSITPLLPESDVHTRRLREYDPQPKHM